MKHVKKSVLLWYSAREMYDLVVGVEDYPRFLPWCDASTILERHAGDPALGSTSAMTARLGLNFAGVRHAFTTRAELIDGAQVTLSLIDGPFSRLDGLWRFHPLGTADTSSACRIEFELGYAFSSRPLETVLSPVFDRVANTFVDSFVKRAAQVYGER